MAEKNKFRTSLSEFPVVNFEEALLKTGYKHAAHCCFYSPNSFKLFKGYESKAYVSMHLRFDGHFGFPGGRIHKNEDVPTGLNRELQEEINLSEKYFVSQGDYVFSNVSEERKDCYHFYTKEITPEEFEDIEKNAIHAMEFGKEVMGVIRVPLCVFKDGYKGFPAFLSNKFIGNAKYQLLDTLALANIMSIEEIDEALSKSLS